VGFSYKEWLPVDNEQDQMARFFERLVNFADEFHEWTSEAPKLLVINPDIVGKLSRIEGFYQRPELEALVPEHAPVVRHFRLPFGVVEIYEDFEEKFLHFE
jgi:hypothetical protein